MRTEWMIPGSEERRWTPRAVAAWACFWAFVVGVSATPSWIISAAAPFRQFAIVIGVVGFYALYLLITSTRWFAGLLTDWRMRRTLKFGYCTRIAASIIFPVGMFCDVFCGLMTSKLLRVEAGDIPMTLLFTITQALTMHAVLFFYMLIVFQFVSYFGRPPDSADPTARGFEVLAPLENVPPRPVLTSEASAPPPQSAASPSRPTSRA